MTNRSALLSEISAVEERLAELTAEAHLNEKKLNSLKQALRDIERSQPAETAHATRQPSHGDHSAEEKVALFRDLFRGRDDVYPQMWINSKTGKKGYSPACRNEWVRGVCDKPRIKCGDCPNQAFLSVTDKKRNSQAH